MKLKRNLLTVWLVGIGILVMCSLFAKNRNESFVGISEICSDYGDILYDADGSCHGFVELYTRI